MKQKCGSFKNKINKPLCILTKRKKEKIQINKIRNENRDITTNTNEIQRIMREYLENLYANKVHRRKSICKQSPEEKDKLLDTFDLPQLHQVDTNHLNRCLISNEIEALIKSHPTKGPRFTAKFYQTFN
jgi:phosphoenolpyruvate carboxylase